MSELVNIEPRCVFEFFEAISQIPHGSRNTQRLVDFCLNFAEKRGLYGVSDSYGNVIIRKNGTPGYEKSRPVILQGHLDMVCEKTAECTVDMAEEGLKLRCDSGYITAEGTTLGADDGIAIAYILALLDSHDIPHPPIEALFTADEEVGLLGAHHTDVSLLKGKRLINIDSEEEGILTVSCAGGVRACCELDLNLVPAEENQAAFSVEISGLKGGHSGVDINSGRKNAHVLMGQLLQFVSRMVDFTLSSLEGGSRTNVIPNHASAVICLSERDSERLISLVKEFEARLQEELKFFEPDVKISILSCSVPQCHADFDSTEKVIFTLCNIPDGICSMCPEIPHMVQTSLNMGELKISEGVLMLGYLIRSNASTGKQQISQRLRSFMDRMGGRTEFYADYPVWEYRPESPLREIMVRAYKELYGKEPEIASIHAGLECGILSGKIPDADMVSFGPTLENVHTPNERMSIASAKRCWEYLLKVLEMLK